MTTRKRVTILLIVVLVLIIAATIVSAIFIGNARNKEKADDPAAGEEYTENIELYNGLPVYYTEADYSFSTGDYAELTRDADYVFAGKILKNIGAEYRNEKTVEGTDGRTFTYTDDYTVYDVEVVKNIKGELGENIEIRKIGGLSKDGRYYSLINGDIFPEVGETYIMFAYEQVDGILIVGGSNSTIPYTEEVLEEIESAVVK